MSRVLTIIEAIHAKQAGNLDLITADANDLYFWQLEIDHLARRGRINRDALEFGMDVAVEIEKRRNGCYDRDVQRDLGRMQENNVMDTEIGMY